MKAFHTNWSKVFAVKHPNQPYEIEDFELLTTMLSALEWRKHNGSIRMVTDQTGYDYYKKLGLLWIWDDGVDNVLDHLIPANVNPHVFWAAAKLYALTYQPAPVVMMDTDFIVWNTLGDRISAYPLSIIHREEINPTVYPQKLFLKTDDDYVWPELDWDIAPCNTAFVCFP